MKAEGIQEDQVGLRKESSFLFDPATQFSIVDYPSFDSNRTLPQYRRLYLVEAMLKQPLARERN